MRHYPHVGTYFDDPRLKAAFTFQDVYMGLSPYEAAATYSFMPYSELEHGVWFPQGGMFRIVETLERIGVQNGVEFLFNAPVERILTDTDHATGICLADGRELPADVIARTAEKYREAQRLLLG